MEFQRNINFPTLRTCSETLRIRLPNRRPADFTKTFKTFVVLRAIPGVRCRIPFILPARRAPVYIQEFHQNSQFSVNGRIPRYRVMFLNMNIAKFHRIVRKSCKIHFSVFPMQPLNSDRNLTKSHNLVFSPNLLEIFLNFIKIP